MDRQVVTQIIFEEIQRGIFEWADLHEGHDAFTWRTQDKYLAHRATQLEEFGAEVVSITDRGIFYRWPS